MIYLVYACENKYRGYHGINSWSIIECDSEKDADTYGEDLSVEVMEEYGILDEIIEEVEAEMRESGVADADWEYDFEEWYSDAIEENKNWTAHRLSDEYSLEEYMKITKGLSSEKIVELYGVK